MDKLKAAYQGICDTITGEELSMGMTYNDQQLSELYDRGANVGEQLHRLWESSPEIVKQCCMLIYELCS